MSKVKAAVFASGTGSNFEAIADASGLPCTIALLVCDNPEAAVIEKAEKRGIKTFVFTPKVYEDKASYEKKIIGELHEEGVQWIFLAGFMRLVGPTLLQAFEGKILNIHPSFLPAFPGKDAIGQAIEAGVKETGVTVHVVDEGMDTGPIVKQEKLPVYGGDTKESLKKRIQEVEHRIYPEVIKELIEQEGFIWQKEH
jgi:phosphoribosylglycinamide formyltransferase-1